MEPISERICSRLAWVGRTYDHDIELKTTLEEFMLDLTGDRVKANVG